MRNGMRGTRGIGGMLHSRECPRTYRALSPNIPGNVTKYSRECCQIFRGISLDIPGNVTKHSGKCRQTFRGISSKIPRNAHNGLTFKFNGRVPKHVLLNYLLFTVDFTSAKKSTKIMLSSKLLLHIFSSKSLIFNYKSQLFMQ